MVTECIPLHSRLGKLFLATLICEGGVLGLSKSPLVEKVFFVCCRLHVHSMTGVENFKPSIEELCLTYCRQEDKSWILQPRQQVTLSGINTKQGGLTFYGRIESEERASYMQPPLPTTMVVRTRTRCCQ